MVGIVHELHAEPRQGRLDTDPIVAGDDDLTSTTLLIVSDLETVVKAATGRQVFVWARDRASGEPVEGARVLVTDGSSVFTEGVTGKDGVWQLDTDHAAKGVLVLSPKGPASSGWEPGPAVAEGWQSKAHVSTDRPVYRPGQKVEWRAIYRRADGGGYQIPKDVEGTVVLLNARGAEVERAVVKSSQTGIFHGEVALDGAAPLGDWTVRLDVEGRSFPGTFRVLEYRKPEFTLTVDPAKPSYRTGETVEAKVRLKYAFGGAVVGAPLEWQVVRMPHDFTPSAVNDYSWYFQDPEALERARVAARAAVQGTVESSGSLSRRPSATRTRSTSSRRAPWTSRGAPSPTRDASRWCAATSGPS